LNNKIDLAQAESVIDVINATTIEAVKSAAQSLSGKFSNKIKDLLKKLIELRVFVEACLDFPEEEIDFIEQGKVIERLNNIAAEVDQILLVAKHGQLLKEGANLVLIGQPNVGKSSLLNQLVGEEKAIVTEIPGTTRDPIASNISIHGVPINVFDTAGLRATNDQVELLGIEKTWESAKNAHLAMVLVDATTGVSEYEKDIVSKLSKNIEILWVYNKIDLIDEEPKVTEHNNHKAIYISAKLDLGIDLLREALREILLGSLAYSSNDTIYIARSRHIDALNTVKACVIKGLTHKNSSELLAEELMLAQNALSSITGEFSSDDLLGKIFSEFCIGK
jgi:tRNA modification GTPase